MLGGVQDFNGIKTMRCVEVGFEIMQLVKEQD
jgi:hypothetical protein